MKELKSIITVATVMILAAVLNSCQKEELVPIRNESEISVQTYRLKSGISVTYLDDLIAKIEFLVSEGILSEGTGNSLISKIKNAIRSVQNGNLNALKGQLNAVINQVEGLIERGVLTPEQGQPLIDAAESELILADGYFVDPRDGEKYTVVQIGTQMWMAENLRATQYNDLTPIPLINWNDWNQQTNGAYNWFDNDITFKLQFGAFYNWYAVNTGKLCPEDWHVPSETEWQVLEDFLKNNGYSYQENGDGYIPVRDGDGVAKSLASMGSQILLY